ncbi:MAG: deiodinase family protein [Pirellulales bacterium]
MTRSLLSLAVSTLTLALFSGFSPCRADDAPGGAASSPPAAEPDWIRVGRSRYDWDWLAKKCDRNADAAVTRDEFPLAKEVFARLDRNWDDKLTAADFDWSKEGALCRQKETTFALFKIIDKDSNGRISPEEWNAHYEKMTADREYLSEEQLERLIYLPRVQKSANETKLRLGRSEYSPGRLNDLSNLPGPNDMAPDFELRTPDAARTIKLSSYRGQKPVVLVFGCFTCGNYRTYSESMEQLYELWKDRAEFVRVYVREAHPVANDQPATSTNARAGLLIKQPTTFEERCDVALKFTSAMQLKTPLVVDEIDNRVGKAYGGSPDRLYLVDRDGRIAFAGGPGPFGFNPRELEQSLAMLVIDQGVDANR